MRKEQPRYHSDPTITRIILCLKPFARGNPNPELTKEQGRRGALESASNAERKAFFARGWVAIGNVGGLFLTIAIGFIVLSFNAETLTPGYVHMDTSLMLMGSVPAVITGALMGVTIIFKKKSDLCDDESALPVIFTKRELLIITAKGSVVMIGVMACILLIGGLATINHAKVDCSSYKSHSMQAECRADQQDH